MNAPFEKYFRLGLVAAVAYPDGFRQEPTEVIRAVAKDSDFEVIELNPLPQTVWADAKRLIETAGLKALCGAQGKLLSQKLNPNALDEDERLKAEKALCGSVDEAAALGADGVAMLAGPYDPNQVQAHVNSLIRTLDSVCAYAKPRGIRVELELFDFDIAKKSLVGRSAMGARVAEDIRRRHSNFGLLIDLSHLPMCYEESADAIAALRPYLTHFHIGNTVIADASYPAYGDEHPRFGFDHSENDVPQLLSFLRALKDNGFFDPVKRYVFSMEVKPLPGENPNVIIANSKRVLNRAWSLLEE